MKKTAILLAAPLLFSSFVKADNCEVIASFAEDVMKYRQDGVSLSVMLSTLPGTDKNIDKVLKQIILDAYRVKSMNYDQNKPKVIADFRDKKHLECLTK